jgi:hypothetical protein
MPEKFEDGFNIFCFSQPISYILSLALAAAAKVECKQAIVLGESLD